jgi:hypothetical protein
MSTIPGELQSLNESEAIIGQLTMTHSPEGLLNLEKTRRYLGVERAECLVGLETAHNLLIDFLWARQYPQIYVIPPRLPYTFYNNIRPHKQPLP